MATVMNGTPVVLFVALAAGLDLAVARDRLRQAPELLKRIAAEVIESVRQFALQPGVKRAVRFDTQFARQRARVKVALRRLDFLFAHAEVHQAALQMGTLDVVA